MKIIDNRFKIEKMIYSNIYFEFYKVIDLWENDRAHFMKLYHYDVQNNLINYFIKDFIELSNIKHENILQSENFSIVKTIDTKKTSMLLYYSISEYIDAPLLEHVNKDLKLEERLEILIQIILALDFLHFRGRTYKFLNPSQIYITEENKVKIQSLSNIVEKVLNSRYTDFEREFTSSEFTMDNVTENKRIDYYSLGNLIEYLFTYEESLSKEQRELLANISKDLIKKDYTERTVNLIDFVDKIIDIFQLDFTYDLTKHRDKMYFNNKVVGREKEISQILEIDRDIYRGKNTYKGILVRGNPGIGRSRFLDEISFRLRMKGRDVYSIDIKESDSNDLLDMSNLLKQSIKDTPSNLIDKYREELSKILPELNLYMEERSELDLGLKTEKYRIYNRISNYFKELSKDKIIYIIVDDIQNSNPNFLQLLNYLLDNTESPNIFFILSHEDKLNLNEIVISTIKELLSNSILIDMKLHEFDLEEIGKIIKDILGMGTVPINFSTALYKETQGNPRHIESLVKHLYNIGQLYMSERGVWHITVDNYSELYIPTNIDEAMLRQLNIVKEKYYEIFKIMSIFDDLLHKKTLVKMLGMEPEELELLLEKLIRLKLIDEKLVEWGYSYSINNMEIKKLIYFELLEEEKIALHKSAVEAILDLKGENIDFVFEELIYHLIKSQQSSRALNIILERIDNLDNIYGSQGIYLLEKAYNIAKDRDDKVKLDILGKLTRIYSIKGKLEDANRHLIEYEELSHKLKEFNHLIKAKTIAANICHIKSQSDLYKEQINEIESISKENNLIEGEIIALSLRARFNIQKGQLNRAENRLKQSIDLSKEHGIDSHLGVLYNRLGVIKFLMGDIKNSIKYYEKSIDFYNQIGNFIDATRPINNIGNVYMVYYGDPEKAKKNYERGLEIASKYNIKEVETIFLLNLGSLSLENYDYEKAREFLLEAKKISIDLQDLDSIFISHINLGKLHLYTGKYNKAYEGYNYLREVFKSGSITNLEIVADYHDFMIEFYMYLGRFHEATEHCIIASDIYQKTNEKEYLKFQFRLLIIKYLENKSFNKDEINEIISKYKETVFVQDSREAFLILSGISLFEGDLEYAFEILEEEKKLKEPAKNNFLDKVRDCIIHCLDPSEEGLSRLISIEEDLEENYRFPMKLIINFTIGSKLYLQNSFKDSIKYFIESLDIVYRNMLKIPDLNFRFSFVESRETDFIKAKLVRAIKKTYGETIEFTRLKDINENQLNEYFDIAPIVDTIGSEEFSKITQLDSYGEALNIDNIEDLISKLTKDYKYNLDLIIKYISKETLANKGYILKLDGEKQKYNIISSLDDKKNDEINEKILKLSDRTEKGLLINDDMLNVENQEYKEFLSDNIRGIICIPITIDTENKIDSKDRRKRFESERASGEYIYLETDKVFNRFNKEKLKTIFKLTYLLHINLESNLLRIEATTDKLTGLYTRKYYEEAFEELINNTKTTEGSFSFLMLDIDGFKNINDSYGHRKGDEVLQEIGKILKSLVRSTDIVARYGGEEFAILLKNVEKEEAMDVAEKIRKAIYSINIKGIDIPISISIGISIFPQHSQFKEELIEKADQALYYAKETGKNKTCCWDYSMTDSSKRADKLAGILTGSTESDNRNILGIIDIIDLIKVKEGLKYKVFEFLGRLLDVVEAEHATLIVLDSGKSNKYTRVRFNEDWVETPVLNKKIIKRVKENRKGEFLIDWDNLDDIDSLSGIPNWESIIVLPLIREGILKGIIYLSSPLKTKEFDFNCYNLSRTLANIFSAIL